MSYLSTAQALVGVNENSQVGEARRSAMRIAELTALNDTERGKVGIVATELATNLVRYATGGEMIIRRFQHGNVDGVEIIAIDRGPGMAEVGKCMEDGFSTGGTAGSGFGAVRRQSTEFDVFSSKPAGTVVASRVLSGSQVFPNGLNWAAVSVPIQGETLCGDNMSVAQQNGMLSIMLADGLGHGALAANASEEAVRIFEQGPFLQPAAILAAAHSPLRTTRGAAMAIAHIELNRRSVRYAGVGNIAGFLMCNGESRGLFSHNGTVGLQIRKIQEFDYPYPERSLLVLHSDGIQSRWDLANFPGLSQRHPAVIAGVLFRDFRRDRDDATVAVVR